MAIFSPMSFRFRFLRIRFGLPLLFLITTLCATAVWRANLYLEHFRDLDRRVAELRTQNVLISSKPADVADFWRKLPGVDPKIFQKVTSVWFPASAEPSDDSVRLLAGMTEIESLTLQASTITDEGAKFLQHLDKLESLHLVSDQVTDVTTEYLAQCHSLKHLDLRGRKIGNASARAIAGLPHLEDLTLNGDRIDDAAVEYLARITRLRLLNLSGKLSDLGLEKLQSCHELQFLWLHGARGATDRTLRALRKLPKLESLLINEGAYTDQALLDLKPGGRLKSIELYDVSVAATESLADHIYSVGGNKRDPKHFYELGGFVDGPCLILDNEWTGEDWDIADATAFATVRDVHIHSPRVHDHGIARLARLGPRLQALTIEDAAITPGVTMYLSRMPVRWLSLAGEKIDDSWVPSLEQLTNLTRLELVNTRISPAGLEKLRTAGVRVKTRSGLAVPGRFHTARRSG